MNKAQIKAELRKEAEKKFPMFAMLSKETYEEAELFLPPRGHHPWGEIGDLKRTFMLLVAEAL